MKYGPHTPSVEALLAKLPTLTDKEWMHLFLNGPTAIKGDSDACEATWQCPSVEKSCAAHNAAYELMESLRWHKAVYDAGHWDYTWNAKHKVCWAIVALVLRDELSEDHFNRLTRGTKHLLETAVA
jgi:hypothetical protein